MIVEESELGRMVLFVSVVVRETMPVTLRVGMPVTVRLVVAAVVRLVTIVSCLIQGLKVDDEDPPSRLQHAPDFADGSREHLGCQVMHDEAADDDVHRGVRKG